MPIRSVIINVTDLDRAIDFYARFLDTPLVERFAEGATLDAVTATLRLVAVPGDRESTFVPDDLQAGFRHIGFKVADLRARVDALHAAGVPFHLEPLRAEGGVDITFFYDPDGTLVELVEGPLQYHEVYQRDAVDRDWALGTPERPRFDHVAATAHDLAETERYFGDLGFTRMAGIHQPRDPRGFEIDFLRDGDSSLEIFTYSAARTTRREPQTTSPGFLAVEFSGTTPRDARPVGRAAGSDLVADANGLVHTATGERR